MIGWLPSASERVRSLPAAAQVALTCVMGITVMIVCFALGSAGVLPSDDFDACAEAAEGECSGDIVLVTSPMQILRALPLFVFSCAISSRSLPELHLISTRSPPHLHPISTSSPSSLLARRPRRAGRRETSISCDDLLIHTSPATTSSFTPRPRPLSSSHRYTCHQNIFSITNELAAPTRSRNASVAAIAVGVALCVYILLGSSGYYTFGSKVSSHELPRAPTSSHELPRAPTSSHELP